MSDNETSENETTQVPVDTIEEPVVETEAIEQARELSDEDREVIASDIKDMNEETFEAYSNKMAVLLSAKNRKAIAEEASQKAEEEAKASEAEEKNLAEAETATEEVVEEVLEETELKTEVPVSTAANEPTVYEKYKAAFDMDGFEFKSHR